jgi:exodeoxyribonuclease-3
MKLVSWNVNGLRACIKKGFLEFVANSDADVICLQEVRALPEQVEFDLPGYTMLWNPALKRGYSGRARAHDPDAARHPPPHPVSPLRVWSV